MPEPRRPQRWFLALSVVGVVVIAVIFGRPLIVFRRQQPRPGPAEIETPPSQTRILPSPEEVAKPLLSRAEPEGGQVEEEPIKAPNGPAPPKGNRTLVRPKPDAKSGVRTMAFSADGKTLAVAYFDGTVLLWDEARGAMKSPPNPEWTGLGICAFSLDGKTLASVERSYPQRSVEPIKLWDLNTGKETARVNEKEPKASVERCLALSPDGKTVVADVNGVRTRVWDIPRRDEYKTITTEEVQCLAFSLDGKTLATGETDGLIKWCDLTKGDPRSWVLVRGHPGWVKRLAFSRDGMLASTSRSDDEGKVIIWDANHEKKYVLDCRSAAEQQQQRSGAVWSLEFSPDGKTLAVGTGLGKDARIALWDVGSGKSKGDLGKHTSTISCLTYSPNGKILACGSDDGAIKLWDTPD